MVVGIPRAADLPIERAASDATDHASHRLGDALAPPPGPHDFFRGVLDEGLADRERAA